MCSGFLDYICSWGGGLDFAVCLGTIQAPVAATHVSDILILVPKNLGGNLDNGMYESKSERF